VAAKNELELGPVKIRVLDDGVFITDAGNLFGGSGSAKIKGAMRPVLIETGDDLVLLDAGFGPELPESLEGRYELRRDDNSLDQSLKSAGYALEDVTHVVLSHLDADHVGWALNPPSFPNATVYVQKDSLEEARKLPEDNARREAIPAVEKGVEEGWCELLEGDCEVTDGVRVQVRSGHAAGHQIVWVGSGDDLALYPADLAPAKIWLDPDLISGVDTDPEAARKNRIEVLEEAESRNAPVLLYHEPGDFLVNVRRSEDGKFKAEPIKG
jgi:glyoxylase-like metal-dependent hydrolase (beta-lactamase superfamily II)